MDASLDGYWPSGTAVAALTSEYAALFDLLQRFVDCFGVDAANNDTETCAKAGTLIDSLYERAQHLFSCEETMLRETDHPQLSNYLREQRIRLAELQLIVKQMKGELQRLDDQLIKTLRNWLVESQFYSKQALSHATESRHPA